MDEMTIGFDAKRAFNNNTGLGNYSRMIISRFAMEHRDCKCILYTPTIDEDLVGYFQGIANVESRQPNGIYRLLQSHWRSHGVVSQIKKDDIDIYHGLSHELPHGLPKEIKKVVTMHDLVAWRFPQYFKKVDANIYQKKQIHACSTADIIIAISEQTKHDLIDIMHVPEEKIRVIYQSCDDIFWYPIEDYEMKRLQKKYRLPEKYFICVGTIEERKNQLSVVRAMKGVPEDIKLIIVGRPRGLYAEEVFSEIKRSGLSNRISVLDDADFEDFPYLYSRSLGTVYLSTFEGFGIPIVEGMCCHVPVLTSNCSSMPEAGGDAVLYADPMNIDEISAQMTRLASDEDLRQQLLEKSKVQLEKFRPQVITKGYYDVYSSLMRQ
ncbi:MAG: glycosyltransferase family 4 protein [Bacteroidales bacterium]|nr:glycosyltransferase family 4 protein [Bacteroidales bacterium]